MKIIKCGVIFETQELYENINNMSSNKIIEELLLLEKIREELYHELYTRSQKVKVIKK